MFRKFLITSDKFTGAAEITYNERSVLCRIDCTQTDMEAPVIDHFKRAVPSTIEALSRGGSFSSETIVVESVFDVTFEMFYKDYPLKRNRYKVEKVWDRMDKAEQVKAYFSLQSYKKYLSKASWQTPMIADRYLRDREYETEWSKIKTQ